ncbi:MAG: hypothetical protein ACE5GE_13995 [Phycisphaerae bacterium]
MTTKRLVACTAMVLAAGGWWAQAGQRPPRKTADQELYQVTAWPDNRADTPYRELLQQHLNRMAAKGWRYNTHLESQGAKMLLFERAQGQPAG